MLYEFLEENSNYYNQRIPEDPIMFTSRAACTHFLTAWALTDIFASRIGPIFESSVCSLGKASADLVLNQEVNTSPLCGRTLRGCTRVFGLPSGLLHLPSYLSYSSLFVENLPVPLSPAGSSFHAQCPGLFWCTFDRGHT